MLDFKVSTVFHYYSYRLLAFSSFPPFFPPFLSDVACASNAECRFFPINL